MLKKIDHIGIAVKDLKESIKKWKDMFGLECGGIEEIVERGVKVALMQLEGSSSIELISAVGEESPVKKFVEEKGEGIHHFCFEVDSIEDTFDQFKRKGIEFLTVSPQKGAEGSLVAFIHPHNFNGVLIELKQKK